MWNHQQKRPFVVKHLWLVPHAFDDVRKMVRVNMAKSFLRNFPQALISVGAISLQVTARSHSFSGCEPAIFDLLVGINKLHRFINLHRFNNLDHRLVDPGMHSYSPELSFKDWVTLRVFKFVLWREGLDVNRVVKVGEVIGVPHPWRINMRVNKDSWRERFAQRIVL
jgi:hypothetical protein